jgi:putative Ca2+/H+ antiporter (TMEM165/GDT1 family)
MALVIPSYLARPFDRDTFAWLERCTVIAFFWPRAIKLEHFLISAGVVALAEIGDKTQLLSLIFAARYRRPIPIVLGVLVATLVNHAGAGGVGALLATWLSPSIMNWAVVASFVLMAVWILVPDKLNESEINIPKKAISVFVTTVFAFFLAEMGDKTQVVTIALAAQYKDFFGVVGGTTMGMMVANVPVICLGSRFAYRLQPKVVRVIASILFVVLAGIAIWNELMPGSPFFN